ncbi:hypothetical protein [Burkholderia oklahomensis]|uniref:hypothetical protein n=1 Tax=Burkholderia oklahomensis TaxID=342113 RepID=UPI001E3BF80B|nr:hypothetical protein [Burkholderia oklahomensis]
MCFIVGAPLVVWGGSVAVCQVLVSDDFSGERRDASQSVVDSDARMLIWRGGRRRFGGSAVVQACSVFWFMQAIFVPPSCVRSINSSAVGWAAIPRRFSRNDEPTAHDARTEPRDVRRHAATSRRRPHDDAKIAAQPIFCSAMFVAIHSRSLSLPVALAACARMAGLNLKKRLPD